MTRLLPASDPAYYFVDRATNEAIPWLIATTAHNSPNAPQETLTAIIAQNLSSEELDEVIHDINLKEILTGVTSFIKILGHLRFVFDKYDKTDNVITLAITNGHDGNVRRVFGHLSFSLTRNRHYPALKVSLTDVILRDANKIIESLQGYLTTSQF